MPAPRMKIEIGMVFNQLTVISKGTPSNAGHPQWNCRCICGQVKVVRQSHLIALTVMSCGCLAKQDLIKRQTTHGGYGTPEYSSWRSMKDRCLNPTDKNYKDYGGRGIVICDQWNAFPNFLTDMGKRPSLQYSIERIDVNGNYEPDNCIWATAKQQSINRRNTIRITFEGITMSLVTWCEMLGVNTKRTAKRMWEGMSFIDAVTQPLYQTKKPRKNGIVVTYRDETKPLHEWCRELSLPYRKTHQRLFRDGQSPERAFS